MKTLTLTKQQARHLVMSLEGTGKGFNIGQLRKLNNILDKLGAPIEEFTTEINRIARSDTNGSARDDLLAALSNTDGQDLVEVEFEDADYDMLKELWGSLEFSANPFVRSVVLGIDDAMQATQAEKV